MIDVTSDQALTTASGATWREAFADVAPLGVGIEEEVMVLDAGTLDLAPRATELVDAAGTTAIRGELPAAQLELVGEPAASVAEAAGGVRALRERAARLAQERGLRLAAAGVHPFAAPAGELRDGPSYERIADEYGFVARREMVFGLHVHVCVRGADTALAVYNALREWMPLVAALASNGPIYDGQDTGLASVRPLIAGLLPRQGVPPAFASWDALAAAHAWAHTAGATPDPSSWWWEVRLHPRWGTIEVRVADAQTTSRETIAVAGVVHALSGWLARRHADGELPEPAEPWRIAENRWRACRYGLDAELADLRTGETRPARVRLAELAEDVAPVAEELGASEAIRDALKMALGADGASRQRAAAAQSGALGTARALAGVFLD